MELLAPAGNIEKMRYAFLYGADAAYFGLAGLSLRSRADNFSLKDALTLKEIKSDKKVYCALNIFFHENDLQRLEKEREILAAFDIDAFIITDMAALAFCRKYFPNTELHLSTQANCLNSEACKIYKDLGFSRIILGRECSLDDIKMIKDCLPEMELEAFVHGAMCLAYSGRCFLSAYMADRSANQGGCAHSCRWEYQLLQEKERPGEYYPVIEGEDFTTILSSRDLCLIDHLGELQKAGLDSLKIEGRMKSLYYTAIVSRAYRKALDALNRKKTLDLEAFKAELRNVSHREYSTGFFFNKEEIETPTQQYYQRRYRFLGMIEKKVKDSVYLLHVKNKININMKIEYTGPDLLCLEDNTFSLLDENFQSVENAQHNTGVYYLKTDKVLKESYLLRVKLEDNEAI